MGILRVFKEVLADLNMGSLHLRDERGSTCCQQEGLIMHVAVCEVEYISFLISCQRLDDKR